MHILTQRPVAEAIARATSTWHHLTRTFACVCRAWRDVARKEECTRLDATLERIRTEYVQPFWTRQRESPFQNVDFDDMYAMWCSHCREEIDCTRESLWLPKPDANEVDRTVHLCSDCCEQYQGGKEALVDVVYGDTTPYAMRVLSTREYGFAYVKARMTVPVAMRWPRNVHHVSSDQLLRSAEHHYSSLRTFRATDSFDRQPVWIDLATDTVRSSCVLPLFADTRLSQLEHEGSFNLLDWIPVCVSSSLYRHSGHGNVVQHVVCVNPANKRFYGERAVLVDGNWNSWPWFTDATITGDYWSTLQDAESDVREAISGRAYALWQTTQRSGQVANWLQAEREVRDGLV